MKIEELLLEKALTPSQLRSEANKLKDTDVEIETLESGKIKVKTKATSGVLIRVINTLVYALKPGNKHDDKEDEEDSDASQPDWSFYFKLKKLGSAFIKKYNATTFTVSGSPLSTTLIHDSFKANSFIIKFKNENPVDDLKQIIKTSIEYHKQDLQRKAEWKSGAADRKKQESKYYSEKQKKRIADLEQKYGKGTPQRVKIRQIDGDDGYQWNVLIDGRSIVNGLSKRSAEHEQIIQMDRIAKNEKLGKYAK